MNDAKTCLDSVLLPSTASSLSSRCLQQGVRPRWLTRYDTTSRQSEVKLIVAYVRNGNELNHSDSIHVTLQYQTDFVNCDLQFYTQRQRAYVMKSATFSLTWLVTPLCLSFTHFITSYLCISLQTVIPSSSHVVCNPFFDVKKITPPKLHVTYMLLREPD